MTSLKTLILLLVSVCTLHTLFAAENTEVDRKREIIKYMRVKNLSLPSELREVHYEMKKHAFDVILVTKIYTLLLGKNASVLNLNYREYYDLRVQVKKKSNKDYSATFEIRDWLERRKPKTLSVDLHQFNIFSDFRMGMYELFYGKKFVRKNREKFLQYNNKKITKIRNEMEKMRSLDQARKKKDEIGKYREKSNNSTAKPVDPSLSDGKSSKKKINKILPLSPYTQKAKSSTKLAQGNLSKKKNDRSRSGKDKANNNNSSNADDLRGSGSLFKSYYAQLNYESSQLESAGILTTQNSFSRVGALAEMSCKINSKDLYGADLGVRVAKFIASDQHFGPWTTLYGGFFVHPLTRVVKLSTGLIKPTFQYYNLKKAGDGLELFEFHPLGIYLRSQFDFSLLDKRSFAELSYSTFVAPVMGDEFDSVSGSHINTKLGVDVFLQFYTGLQYSASTLDTTQFGQNISVHENAFSLFIMRTF